MKIQEINKFYKKIGEFQIRHRLLFIIIALALTAFGLSGLGKTESANSRDDWFDDSERIEIETDKFENQFGNNDAINVLIESDDVFKPEVLRVIKAIGEELEENVPYANEVTSLVETEISIGTEDGMQVINPFEDGIPDDPGEIEEIRNLVLSRKALKNRIVTDDSRETWLSLSLYEYPEKEEWQKETTLDPMYQAGEAAVKVLTDPKWESDAYTIKPVGMPYTETEERDFFAKETKLRVLSGFILMIVLLVFFTRSFRGVFVPVFSTIMGIVVVFGVMGWLGVTIDANMVTLPVLLGMALSVGYSIHLVNSFKRIFRKSGNRTESVVQAVEETGWPLFFTAITTIGSLLSFLTAGIITIKWVGYASAAVVFVDYLFVTMLIPVLMSFGKNSSVNESEKTKNSRSEEWMRSLGKGILARRKLVLGLFVFAVVILIPEATKISVDMDMFKFMGTKVPYIKRVYDVTRSRLGSYISYNISIDLKEADRVKDPQVLLAFEEILTEVEGFELTKKNSDAASVFSVLDIVKEMNQTLNGDDPDYYKVPESSGMVAQVLLLYEISGGTKLFKWIDEDYSMLRAQVQVTEYQAKEIVAELERIKELGHEKLPDATITIVGSAVQFAEINNKIVIGEVKSILAALAIIALLLVVVFGSFKTGLIGMIPNVTPLLFIASYMGYFDSPLDMMTMTIMPMMLGIAVDDTIHFTNHIKYEFELCGNYYDAIINSFATVGKTLAMTTIILAATFAMYIFSPVANLGRIGYLASLGLIMALITDYIVTPTLIYLTRPFGKEKAEDEESELLEKIG